jgi:carbon storage regulator
MLILTRKPGEKIFMGPNAEIKFVVLGVRGKQVKLGIEAPGQLEVHRAEVFLDIQASGRRKAG